MSQYLNQDTEKLEFWQKRFDGSDSKERGIIVKAFKNDCTDDFFDKCMTTCVALPIIGSPKPKHQVMIAHFSMNRSIQRLDEKDIPEEKNINGAHRWSNDITNNKRNIIKLTSMHDEWRALYIVRFGLDEDYCLQGYNGTGIWEFMFRYVAERGDFARLNISLDKTSERYIIVP